MSIFWRLKTNPPPQKLGWTPLSLFHVVLVGLSVTVLFILFQGQLSMPIKFLLPGSGILEHSDTRKGEMLRAEKVEWLGLDKVILIIHLFLGSGSPALPLWLLILWSSIKCISLFSREKVSLFLFKLARTDKYCLQVGNLNEYSIHLWCTLQMDEALPVILTIMVTQCVMSYPWKREDIKKMISDINVGVIGKNMVAKIPELNRHFSCFIYQQGAKIKKYIHMGLVIPI